MGTLRERRQQEKLVVFERLWYVLILSVGIAGTTLICQIVALNDNHSKWGHEWLFTYGVSHFLFLVVLVVMMHSWAPHQNSQRYVYSQQIDNCDSSNTVCKGNSIGASCWVEDEEEPSIKANSPNPASVGEVLAFSLE